MRQPENADLCGMNRIFYTLLLLFSIFASGQSTRITDRNGIGWLAFTGTFKVTDKFGIHSEYQWRRENFPKDWQQGLLRVGVNYQVDPAIQLRLGYAWAETFNYGDIPLNGFGKTFTEHRMFEMATISQSFKKLLVSHRFMLEQRWVGRFDSAESESEDEYLYSNRARYMLRLQHALKPSNPKSVYIALYDEVFIGFGNNVGENIFDQNRIGIIAGLPVSQQLKIEGGYLNQIVQFGREIEGRNVIQRNNGFILSAILNLDCRPKTAE